VYSVIVLSNQADVVGDEAKVTSYNLQVSKIQQNYQQLNVLQPMLGVVQKDAIRFFLFSQRDEDSNQLEKISF